MPTLPFSADGTCQGSSQAKRFQRRSSTVTRSEVSEDETRERHILMQARILQDQHPGFRSDYKLGDTIRSPSHIMVTEPSAVSAFEKHDFAFVKRSDGSYVRHTSSAFGGTHDICHGQIGFNEKDRQEALE